MKSSKSRWKLNTEDICKEYFALVFGREDGVPTPAHFVAHTLINQDLVDSIPGELSFNTFAVEVIAVNIELFGLVWLTFNYNPRDEQDSPESLGPAELVFTRKYLEETGRSQIWESMGFYNSVLPSERRRRWDKIFVEGFDKTLTSSLTKYTADSECIRRLINRYYLFQSLCEPAGIACFSQSLTLALEERLACQLNRNALFALERLVVALYVSAVDYLEAVRDFGSYNAALDATKRIAQLVKNAVKKRK